MSNFFSWMRENNIAVYIVFFLFVCCSALIINSLYTIQVVDGNRNVQIVDGQHNAVYNNDEFTRGNIYLSYKNGTRLLASTNKEYFSLIINNKNIRNADAVKQGLADIVDFDNTLFKTIVAKTNDPYEVLLPRITDQQAQQIRSAQLGGVELHVNQERFYPLGSLASSVVGFTSFQDGQWQGTYGLEKYYDTILRRYGQTNNGSIFSFLFGSKNGADIDNQSNIEKHIAKEGSLVTTIEPHVQDFLEKELAGVTEKYDSQYSAGIIMDPDTGEIVAMVSGNEFDINTSSTHYRNRLIENRYEFGSIMKPITVAIGLDSAGIDTDFVYNDTGSLTMDRYTFYNHDKSGRGAGTNLQTILTQSLNTGAATIALEIGFDVFEQYIYDLGLDSETGIDLPFETYGTIANLGSRRNVELATASFGQGVAFTAIEMMYAWSALANRGISRTPHVVQIVEYGDLIPSANVPAGLDMQIFDKQTVDDVTDMLIAIVDDSSTFKPYSIEQYSVALKTGTAQVVHPNGGYYDNQFLHSMIGYFPAKAKPDEQQFLIMIFTSKPQGVRYSSTTLKNPFFNTVQYLINYYNVKPDRNLSILDNIE